MGEYAWGHIDNVVSSEQSTITVTNDYSLTLGRDLLSELRKNRRRLANVAQHKQIALCSVATGVSTSPLAIREAVVGYLAVVWRLQSVALVGYPPVAAAVAIALGRTFRIPTKLFDDKRAALDWLRQGAR